MSLLKTSVVGNATRQWLLIAISHVVLYDVKRNLAANKAHFWNCCRNMGHFRCGVEMWWNFIFTKMVNFYFFPLETKKTTFCCWNFEHPWAALAPFPTAMPIYICNVCEFLETSYCIPMRWPMGPQRQSLPPWLKPLVTPLRLNACEQK